jgi:protein TonB
MRRLALLSVLLHAAVAVAVLLIPFVAVPPPAEPLAKIELVFGPSDVAPTPPALSPIQPVVAPVTGDGERASLAAKPVLARPATPVPGLRVEHPDDSFVPVRDDPGNHAPEYPQGAYQRHEQGTVTFRIHVTPNGSVERLEKLASSGYADLDDAAEHAMAGWHFVPARRNGQPVESYRDQPMTFLIQ